MHHDNFVAALQSVSAPAKSFREYEHDKTQDTSSCNIVLPFDTEYAFLFKVLDDQRRRVVVTIDGSDAFDLILDKGTHVIERFGETARRFKFVKANNDAVSDPTSTFNGKIQVKVCTEKPWFHIPAMPQIWHDPQPLIPNWPWPSVTDRVYRSNQHDYGLGDYSHIVGGGLVGSNEPSVMYCSAGPVSPIVPEDAGATIEGSKSDQKFGTTCWRGDDAPYSFFNFTLKGQVKKLGHCVECGEKLGSSHKFCGHCGTRV